MRAGISKDLAGRAYMLKIPDDEATIQAKIEAEVQVLRTAFPDNAPFVLSHGDLHMGNIIVNDGKIVANIDWELAGYYPWWVERNLSYRRAIGEQPHELFNMVWAGVDPQWAPEEFGTQIARYPNTVRHYYERAPIQHTHSHDAWQRPRWCECKPYGGQSKGFHCEAFGAQSEHRLEPDKPHKTFEWLMPYYVPPKDVKPMTEEDLAELDREFEQKFGISPKSTQKGSSYVP